MTRSRSRRWLFAALLVPGLASADAGPEASLRVWAGPDGTFLQSTSPYGGGVDAAGLGREQGRGEAVLRISFHGAAGELSARQILSRGGETGAAVVTELYQELDALGQHFTVGKKVTSWDVGYGFRPLDVVEQERRRELHPFALEGVPLLAWEWLDERTALTALWAHPLMGRSAVPEHDESVAARVFRRLGPADLQMVARGSERTGPEGGAALAVVLGEPLELHGSVLWQARGEHLAQPDLAEPLKTAPPGPSLRGAVASSLLGFTLTPGLGLTFLGETWYDPAGDGPSTWRARRRLSQLQRALGEEGLAPGSAVAGNLAFGLLAFDRQSLLRQNLLARVSATLGRFEPAVDLLFTPEDRGSVTTLSCGYQGERLRWEGALRILGGPPGSAYALFPEWATWYLAAQISL